MISPPVLALPNFSDPFVIETDASGSGLGAVLCQNGHPLAYASKALTPSKRCLSTYEREILAILFAVKQWRSYLGGRKFFIRTDHLRLKHLLEQKDLNEQQFKWLHKLWGLHYEILYRKGSDNVVADALSRRPENSCMAISTPISPLYDRVRDYWLIDTSLQQLIKDLEQNPDSHSKFTWQHQVLKRQGKLVVAADRILRKDLLTYFHADGVGGHSGIHSTFKRLASVFYWKGMEKDVRNFVRECVICQRFKLELVASPGLLQPLPIPNHVWTELSMDFISGLPKSYSKTTILVVVDRLSKAAHFMALKHPFTAMDVALLFMDNVVKLHGFPKSIVSDRDPIFCGKFWKELFRLYGVNLHYSSAYHPQTDGQTEVLNRCLECYLRCMTGDFPKQWVKWLSLAELWYNTTYHSATGMTPFEAVYGVPPPIHLPYIASDSSNDLVDQTCLSRELVLSHLKDHLLRAQHRMVQQANKHRSERQLHPGDMVYLKLHPFRRNLLNSSCLHKLAARYFGPFQVLKKIGAVAYELALPATTRVHPVFHVSLLKKHVGPAATVAQTLPPVDDQGQFALEPEFILGRKLVRRNHLSVTQVLVQWKLTQPEDATWEDLSIIQAQFPHFSTAAAPTHEILVDKDSFRGK
ncbi:hypothetical protein QN277_019789 [Acacia crassicarpa]|nr:hypothetical protein QN277_019789 [Acacia crassicarpa]